MSLAILCSGQGPQHAAMFALTGDAPAAASLFARATALLGGHDPRDLVRSTDEARLHENRLGQILCTLQPLAALATFERLRRGRRIVAGYSVGEVAAWALAGLIAPDAALDLAVGRAESMDAASRAGDGLLFVRGLARNVIDAVCAAHGTAVAIVNPGDAFIIGGTGEALAALARDPACSGAERLCRVGVNVASHTLRLAPAASAFRRLLEKVAVARRIEPEIRLLSGVDGAAVLDVSRGLDKLAGQIAQTVEWAECLAACVEAGARAFLECGPGRALAAMAGSAYPHIPSRSLDDFRSPGGVDEWLWRVLS